MLRERNILTSNSKFRQWPGSGEKLTAKRNFKFGVNIFLSRSRWATLYTRPAGHPLSPGKTPKGVHAATGLIFI